MSKTEKEFKILNIDVENVKEKLKTLGATDKGLINQKICVYDLPTLYYRFLEIKELLKSNNKLIINTNLLKLNNLFTEYEDLVTNEELTKVLQSCKISSLKDILKLDIQDILKVLENPELNNSLKKFMINPNKWIRLRQSNDKVELCTKHVLEKSQKDFQDVLEIEFTVSDFDETNAFLNAIGISQRSIQEKKRHEYIYKDAEIEIDIWPMLKPYLEIECDNDDTIKEIINVLGVSQDAMVSFNTAELYRQINKNIYEISELKF